MRRCACLLLCLVTVRFARAQDCTDADGDAFIDCEDSACAELCGTEVCHDGADNDHDGKTDCEDEDCRGRPPCMPEHCGNAVDDDGDELADCADPNCANDYCYCGSGSSVFLRGDADDSGEVNMTDAIVILGHLFLGEKAPECLHAADADNNNLLEITDPIRILKFLFLGEAAPESPFPSCGGEYDWESEWPTCRQPSCCP